jgi:hypothetical protein
MKQLYQLVKTEITIETFNVKGSLIDPFTVVFILFCLLLVVLLIKGITDIVKLEIQLKRNKKAYERSFIKIMEEKDDIVH